MKTKLLSIILISSFLIFTTNCRVNPSQSNATTEHSYELESDITWASPEGFDLTMDIYTPNTGKRNYPVIVIFHGGGWLINNKSIMKQTAEYLAKNGEYVVCNVNYRLLGDLENTVTIDEIVEDAFGAVLWIKSNIKQYKGNPKKVIVTGDSAGGHLAMMVTAQGHQLSSDGFDGKDLAFNPSWLPKGKTAEAIAKKDGLKVQAAMLSYGAFDIYDAAEQGYENRNFFWVKGRAEPRGMMGKEYSHKTHPELYKKVSPMYNIPNVTDKKLPPLLFTVGSEDETTPPESIEKYIGKLKTAGHTNIQYWIHENRPHAFLDAGKNRFLKINFEDDGIPALDKMLVFLNEIFY
ncbi:MAG: alpha/beta hydrolase [Saprospiraceae bacterium]